MVPKNEILKSGILDFKIIPVPEDVKFRGNKEKNKGMLVAITGENPFSDEFLGKVLNAVKINPEHDALTVHLTPGQRFGFIPLAREAGIRNAIFFGTSPLQAGLNFQVQKYELLRLNEISYLFADELAKIEKDNELKKRLWRALQEMFIPKMTSSL